MSDGTCIDDETLFMLVDEPNEAKAAAAHVAGCAACTERKRELEGVVGDLREPVRTYPVDAFADGLRQQLSSGAPSRGSRGRVWQVAGAATLALSLAAGVVFAPRILDHKSADEFASRGSTVPGETTRDVDFGVDLVVRRAGAPAEVKRASADVVVSRDAHLVGSFGTRGASASAFVLCFAVDSASEVHWLYPAYETSTTDPPSAELPAGRELGAMPTEVVLDSVAAGPVRVFAVLTTAPLHVSDIERLSPSAFETSSLEARFRGADVRTWSFVLGSK